MNIFADVTWNSIFLAPADCLEWLKHFTEKGLLVKKGASNAPIYFLAEKELNK